MSFSTFHSGWSPTLASNGRARFELRGGSLSTLPQFADDDRPMPPGFSLSSWIQWAYDQGQIGSCFSNMAAIVLQIMMFAAVANGSQGKPFNPSRRLVWYRCRQLDGTLGSSQDGGSICNAFAAMGEPPSGIGDCSETEWPYKPDHAWLEETPPASVVTDASLTRISHIAEMPFDVDKWKRSIFNLDPVGIGIWWPYGWDNEVDQYGRTTGIGRGEFGHALAVIGWIDNWDGHRYWEIQNSHGPIYGVPDAATQKTIVGYKPSAGPSKTFSFWAREDYLQSVLAYQGTESYNAAGVDGFIPKPINTPSLRDAIPY